MGWRIRSVETRLGEAKTEIKGVDDFEGKGGKKTEEKITGFQENV